MALIYWATPLCHRTRHASRILKYDNELANPWINAETREVRVLLMAGKNLMQQ